MPKLTELEKDFLRFALEREATYIGDCIKEYEEKTGKVHIFGPAFFEIVAKEIKSKLEL